MGRGYGSARAGLAGRSAWLAALLASTAIAAGLMVPARPALAQAEQFTFDIPAGPLSQALVSFGRQAGLQVTYGSAVASGKTSPGVSGATTADAALTRLLEGTGLTFSYVGTDTVVITASNAPVVDDGSIVLEEVNVAAWVEGAASGSGFQGTPDWVYETPGSLSVISREAIQSNAGARDARDLLANVAGAYVNNSVSASPAISPNVRGLQDMGRVVISIDGARQNANRTISSGGDSYVAGAGKGFVDPAFIRSVEVERTTGAEAGLAGSLAGAVTFRTVTADDLIQDGRDWGIETNTTFGSNNQHFQGSILGAAHLADSPFSVVAGLSSQNLGNYRVGTVGTLEWSGETTGVTGYMDRENWSSLLKLEGDFGDLTTSLAWTHQNKVFSWAQGEDNEVGSDELAIVDTVTAALDYSPDDNKLIDLHTKLWFNGTQEDTLRHARGDYPTSGYPDTEIDADFISFGASIDNTSRFDTALGGLALSYGLEAFRDNGTSSASSEAIDAWPELESNFTSFSPEGVRDMASLFISGDLEPTEWVTLSGGLRYDWYHLQGTPTYYSYQDATTYTASCVMSEYDYRLAYMPSWDPTTASTSLKRILQNRCGEVYNGTFYTSGTVIAGLGTPVSYPGTTMEIDRSGGALLPSASIEFKPVDWFRPYISYSESYRPPTTAEAFFTGDLPSATNPGYQYAPNAALRPERAQTWEVGANVSLDGVLSDRDTLRMKVSAFDRSIEDFIVVGYFYTSETSQQYTGYVNAEDLTRMRGIEIEANYDARDYWIGGSATWLETEWPQTVQSTWYGQQTTDDTIQMYAGEVPPALKVTLDAGVRLFEEKVSLGARLTHATPMEQRFESLDVDGSYVANQYTKLDLYGSYAFSDSGTLRLGIDNVTDVNYAPAGSRFPAPGRTATLSLNMKF